MSDDSVRGLSRFAMELGVAALTGAFGAAVCFGAVRAGAGWTEFGPDAGYFPFYIGLLIVLGSAMNVVQAFTRHRKSGTIFLDGIRVRAVSSFLLPLLAFAAVSSFLGLYVGTALYIAAAMIFQGKYRWWIGALSGVAVSLAFFTVFELGFRVPLLKGPVETWLGIH